MNRGRSAKEFVRLWIIKFQVSYSFCHYLIWALSERLGAAKKWIWWSLVTGKPIYYLFSCFMFDRFTARGLASCKTSSFLWRVYFWVCGMHDPTNKTINKLRKSITPNSKFYWKHFCNPHFFHNKCALNEKCVEPTHVLCVTYFMLVVLLGLQMLVSCLSAKGGAMVIRKLAFLVIFFCIFFSASPSSNVMVSGFFFPLFFFLFLFPSKVWGGGHQISIKWFLSWEQYTSQKPKNPMIS